MCKRVQFPKNCCPVFVYFIKPSLSQENDVVQGANLLHTAWNQFCATYMFVFIVNGYLD